MTKRLYIACAGAGKTQLIIEDAVKLTNKDIKVLVVTYTENNQKELKERFVQMGGTRFDLFVVKGWYTFLLEEIIRPYQICIFPQRIGGIFFTTNNPHRINGNVLSGRSEKINKAYNPKHFFDSRGYAYTEFISKLAVKIIKESKVRIESRLEEIYEKIYFDEVQDLASWDFDLLDLICKSKIMKVIAVGDFRQTLYSTSNNPSKKPKTKDEKLALFKSMGFNEISMNESKRSILDICSFSDLVHLDEGYTATLSNVNIPVEVKYSGLYAVLKEDVESYIKEINPLVLRDSKSSGKYLPKNCNVMNFGESKGLTADHVLIVPTKAILDFIKNKENPFTGKTDVGKNRAYVAITRARYSVAFVVNEEIEGLTLYKV